MHLVVMQAPEAMTPGDREARTIVVRVLNGDGTPVAGIPVAWRIASGGGTVRAASETSGIDGLAAAQWRAGSPAEPQELAVSIYNQPAVRISAQADVFHADKLSTTFERGCGLQASRRYGAGGTIIRDDPFAVSCPRSKRTTWPPVTGSPVSSMRAGTTYCDRAFGTSTRRRPPAIPGLPPIAEPRRRRPLLLRCCHGG